MCGDYQENTLDSVDVNFNSFDGVSISYSNIDHNTFTNFTEELILTNDSEAFIAGQISTNDLGSITLKNE
jgi:hypothetical protein